MTLVVGSRNHPVQGLLHDCRVDQIGEAQGVRPVQAIDLQRASKRGVFQGTPPQRGAWANWQDDLERDTKPSRRPLSPHCDATNVAPEALLCLLYTSPSP